MTISGNPGTNSFQVSESMVVFFFFFAVGSWLRPCIVETEWVHMENTSVYSDLGLIYTSSTRHLQTHFGCISLQKGILFDCIFKLYLVQFRSFLQS